MLLLAVADPRPRASRPWLLLNSRPAFYSPSDAPPAPHSLSFLDLPPPPFFFLRKSSPLTTLLHFLALFLTLCPSHSDLAPNRDSFCCSVSPSSIPFPLFPRPSPHTLSLMKPNSGLMRMASIRLSLGNEARKEEGWRVTGAEGGFCSSVVPSVVVKVKTAVS